MLGFNDWDGGGKTPKETDFVWARGRLGISSNSAADSAAKDTIDGNILGKSIRSTFNLGWSPKQITFGLLQSRQNVFYPVVQTVENNSGLSSLDYKSPVLAIHMQLPHPFLLKGDGPLPCN